jgi:Uma2 family endonuclease
MIEQFLTLELPEDREWELHDGEIVDTGAPSIDHRQIQLTISDLFRSLFPNAQILIELPFQIGNSYRSADVGITSKERRAKAKKLLDGAPELVVEVLSPSNTELALSKYRRLCFANGTRIFLLVDPDERVVQVWSRRESEARTLSVGDFAVGEQMAFELFGTTVTLKVEEIFG